MVDGGFAGAGGLDDEDVAAFEQGLNGFFLAGTKGFEAERFAGGLGDVLVFGSGPLMWHWLLVRHGRGGECFGRSGCP